MTTKKHGGARPVKRTDDGRLSNPGGERTGAGRPRTSKDATTLQISIEHSTMLDTLAAASGRTKRNVAEELISASYAELEAMWQDAADMAGEII